MWLLEKGAPGMNPMWWGFVNHLGRRLGGRNRFYVTHPFVGDEVACKHLYDIWVEGEKGSIRCRHIREVHPI